MSKNYYSMTLPNLLNELKLRNIGDADINRELSKFYGVVGLPPQQAAARTEAIRRLKEHDERKKPFRKFLVIIAAVVGFIASVATIVSLFR